MELKSMSDFVLEQNELRKQDKISVFDFAYRVKQMAEFLKQPLNLGMFVPCDLDGIFLKEPIQTDLTCSFYQQQEFFNIYKEYQQSQERVLFKGLELCKDAAFYSRVVRSKDNSIRFYVRNEFDIENLIKYNLTLTQSAIKQLGL